VRPDDRLDGQRCIVTGGSLGIGAAIARGLAARGAQVIIACRDVVRGERTRAAIAASTGARVTVERLDVSRLDEIDAFAAAAGPVDVLVNNAGASFPEPRRSADGLELSFATNALGGFALVRALRPKLRPGARVIHVGSIAQYLVRLRTDELFRDRGRYRHELAYARSKRAQFELSERWAAELAPDGIRSACVHPGLVSTPGAASAFPRYHRLVGRLLPDPSRGAATALWLAGGAGASGGLWFANARQPADLLPWTRTPAEERERLWRACERWVETRGRDGAA